MSAIDVIPATVDHARALAPRMRAADRDEVWASGGFGPLAALERSLALSPLAWTGTVDGVPACMFGAASASLLGGEGVPWLLGSDLIERHQRAFLRRNREYVRQMQAAFPVLRNMVDARNMTSIRWLRWLGFTIGPAVRWGTAGLPFHPFWMIRDV